MNNMVPSLSSYFSVCEKHTMIFQSNCPKQQYFLLISLVIHDLLNTAIPRDMLPLDMLTPQIRHYELRQKAIALEFELSIM